MLYRTVAQFQVHPREAPLFLRKSRFSRVCQRTLVRSLRIPLCCSIASSPTSETHMTDKLVDSRRPSMELINSVLSYRLRADRRYAATQSYGCRFSSHCRHRSMWTMAPPGGGEVNQSRRMQQHLTWPYLAFHPRRATACNRCKCRIVCSNLGLNGLLGEPLYWSLSLLQKSWYRFELHDWIV